MLCLRTRNRLVFPLNRGHVTPAVRRSHDLPVWHLLHMPSALFLVHLLLVVRPLGSSLLLRCLLLCSLPRLLLSGLSLDTLLRLALCLGLRWRLADGALRTSLLVRCNGLVRLTYLLRLLLPFVHDISLAVVLLARLPRSLPTRLALGAWAHLLASEPTLNGRLWLGRLVVPVALFLLLLATHALFGCLLARHLTTSLHLGFATFRGLATHATLLGRLELHLLSQRQLARSLLALDLAPVFLTAEAPLHARLVIGLSTRTGISI